MSEETSEHEGLTEREQACLERLRQAQELQASVPEYCRGHGFFAET
jgi:hypothetical protein